MGTSTNALPAPYKHRLARLVDALGSIRALSHRLNVSDGTVSSWLDGKHSATSLNRARIDALYVEVCQNGGPPTVTREQLAKVLPEAPTVPQPKNVPELLRAALVGEAADNKRLERIESKLDALLAAWGIDTNG